MANPRCLHYYVAVRTLLDWNAKPYLNVQLMSKYLTDASKWARYLGMVDYDVIIDAKNPPPQIHRNYSNSEINIDRDNKIQFKNTFLKGVDYDKWVRSEEEKFSEVVTATLYSDDIQSFHLELFIEKTDHDRIIDPVCERYSTNYQAFKGEGSLSAASQLIKRIEHINKPIRILYISDFDPKGSNMPIAFARKIEFLVRTQCIKKDIKVKHIALTRQQVEKYKLPKNTH